MASAWVGGVKTPPYSVHAEKALLGALLVTPKRLADVRSLVTDGTMFFRSQHGQIYDTMLALYRKRRSVPLSEFSTRLVDALRKNDLLESIGGTPYLARLEGEAAVEERVVEMAKLIREKAMLRSLIEVASDILSDAYSGGEDYHQVLDRARSRLDGLLAR